MIGIENSPPLYITSVGLCHLGILILLQQLHVLLGLLMDTMMKMSKRKIAPTFFYTIAHEIMILKKAKEIGNSCQKNN